MSKQLFKAALANALAALFPGYFAFVMATGIVSLAAHFHGREQIAVGWFGLNAGAYVVLWILTLIRLAWFRGRLLDDLPHHLRGVIFMTKAAGTCVPRCQFALLTPWMQIAKALWLIGAGLWAVLSYTNVHLNIASIPLDSPLPQQRARWTKATCATLKRVRRK